MGPHIELLTTLATYIAKGLGLLLAIAATLFAFGLVGCFINDAEGAPRWAKISGGVILLGTMSLAFGWMMSL